MEINCFDISLAVVCLDDTALSLNVSEFTLENSMEIEAGKLLK